MIGNMKFISRVELDINFIFPHIHVLFSIYLGIIKRLRKCKIRT